MCFWIWADSIWVVESVPAYSCLFSAFPEGWSSATADKVRKLLYYLLKASHNNKIPVWHPFCLILWTGIVFLLLNHHCHWATAFRGGKENRLRFLLLHFMFNMLMFGLPLIKVWFQSSSDWCKLGLSASPALSWLSAYVVMMGYPWELIQYVSF